MAITNFVSSSSNALKEKHPYYDEEIVPKTSKKRYDDAEDLNRDTPTQHSDARTTPSAAEKAEDKELEMPDLSSINPNQLANLKDQLRLINELSNCKEEQITYLAVKALLAPNGYVKFIKGILPNCKVAIDVTNGVLRKVYLKTITPNFKDLIAIGFFKVTWSIREITCSPYSDITAPFSDITTIYQKNEHLRTKYPSDKWDFRCNPPSSAPESVERYYQAMKKEIAIQSGLNHPNIVKIRASYEYTNSKGQKKIALMVEKLPCTLENFLITNGDFIDFSSKIKMAKQLASGASFILDNGFTHNDLKSDNVFLAENEDIKIGDFGLSTELHTKSPFNSSLIDPPEIKRTIPSDTPNKQGIHEKTIVFPRNEKTDVFQYGLLLWEIFKPDPFQARNTSKIEEMFKNWPTTPQYNGMRCLIGSCLRKDPTERPTFADIQSNLDILNACDC